MSFHPAIEQLAPAREKAFHHRPAVVFCVCGA